MLSSILSQAASSGTLTNPVKFSRFLSAATAATKVDQKLDVTGLADQLRYVGPSAVSFTTVPLASTNFMTSNGQSAVLWNQAAARALFHKIKSDQWTKQPHEHRHHRAASGGGQSVWQAKPKTAAQAACH